MSKFLKNIQHNNYLEQPITYSKYICKNCNAKNKVYEYSNDERDPKDISNIGYIDVSINDNIIYVTTPIMICPFGFNKETDILTLQFSNVKTDNEMKSFFYFIQNLEHNQMKYIGLGKDETDQYLSQIRYDKEMKYDPNLVVKVPFQKNRYNVDIRNKESSYSVKNIYKFSKVKCDIYIDKIWKFNGKYVCKWKVRNILII